MAASSLPPQYPPGHPLTPLTPAQVEADELADIEISLAWTRIAVNAPVPNLEVGIRNIKLAIQRLQFVQQRLEGLARASS